METETNYVSKSKVILIPIPFSRHLHRVCWIPCLSLSTQTPLSTTNCSKFQHSTLLLPVQKKESISFALLRSYVFYLLKEMSRFIGILYWYLYSLLTLSYTYVEKKKLSVRLVNVSIFSSALFFLEANGLAYWYLARSGARGESMLIHNTLYKPYMQFNFFPLTVIMPHNTITFHAGFQFSAVCKSVRCVSL